jgi:hypothetical protein
MLNELNLYKLYNANLWYLGLSSSVVGNPVEPERSCKKNILLIDACTKKGKLWHGDFNYLCVMSPIGYAELRDLLLGHLPLTMDMLVWNPFFSKEIYKKQQLIHAMQVDWLQ